ncbi:Ankyrin repeat-containing protein [Glycine soja]|nr:Ankyrin repeat-containing protein [Glycine soja]
MEVHGDDDPVVMVVPNHSEDSNIEITISPESDHIPSQSHEQTPVAASPQLDGNGGVNEITPEDLSSLKRKVYVYALRDMWLEAQPIFQNNPNMLRIPLTANRDDTALNVAVSGRSTTFVEGLVSLMSPEDLIIPRISPMDTHIGGPWFKMDESNEYESESNESNEYEYESESNEYESMDDSMAYNHIERLFFTTIEKNTFVKSGNLDALKRLIGNNSEVLMTIKDSDGMSLLHKAVLCRQRSIVSYIQGFTSREDNLVLGGVDNKGNNVLHLAAAKQQSSSHLLRNAKVEMQNDLAWFKEIEKKFHEFSYNTMVNDKGKTPEEVFYDQHEDLSDKIKDDSKEIANSGMIVAILVATVAFAAALTVPGEKTNAWFVVFIFTNAVALFASSASILSFLSNFTSLRFGQREFVKSLHPSLTFGPVLLFISVVAMVVAFTAASFLIFDHTSKWVSYAVASMGFFPLLLFILFQFRFFDDSLWSRYYRLSKFEKFE